MILTIDVGNSNIVIGGVEGQEILFEARLRTEATKTSDQYCVDLKILLDVYGVETKQIEGSIISVVKTKDKKGISRFTLRDKNGDQATVVIDEEIGRLLDLADDIAASPKSYFGVCTGRCSTSHTRCTTSRKKPVYLK